MKKHILIALTIASALFLSACGSSVSIDEYTAVVSENTSLKTEVESLSAENQTLSDKVQQLLSEKIDLVTNQLPNSSTLAWADASFGSNSICLSDSDGWYLQCIAGNTYPISDEGIAELWHDFLISLDTLALARDSMPYETISIKFNDPSCEPILEFTLDMTEDVPKTRNIMVNGPRSTEIVAAFNKIHK